MQRETTSTLEWFSQGVTYWLIKHNDTEIQKAIELTLVYYHLQYSNMEEHNIHFTKPKVCHKASYVAYK